jgi:hypothetical protein
MQHKVRSEFRNTTQALESFNPPPIKKDFEVKKQIGFDNLKKNR